jgi:hypothetical protein
MSASDAMISIALLGKRFVDLEIHPLQQRLITQIERQRGGAHARPLHILVE